MMNKDILEKLYWKEKLTLSKIGKKFNKSAPTIRYWMKKYNIPRRTISETKIKPLSEEIKKELERLYWNEKLSLMGIAEIFNCSNATIWRWMKKYGIPIRNVSEAKKGEKNHLSKEDKQIKALKTLKDLIS